MHVPILSLRLTTCPCTVAAHPCCRWDGEQHRPPSSSSQGLPGDFPAAGNKLPAEWLCAHREPSQAMRLPSVDAAFGAAASCCIIARPPGTNGAASNDGRSRSLQIRPPHLGHPLCSPPGAEHAAGSPQSLPKSDMRSRQAVIAQPDKRDFVFVQKHLSPGYKNSHCVMG